MSANPTDRQYVVVINAEEQYSIWPQGRVIPEGWESAGFEGKENECADYIDRVWRDMRPRSLRQALAAQSTH